MTARTQKSGKRVCRLPRSFSSKYSSTMSIRSSPKDQTDCHSNSWNSLDSPGHSLNNIAKVVNEEVPQSESPPVSSLKEQSVPRSPCCFPQLVHHTQPLQELIIASTSAAKLLLILCHLNSNNPHSFGPDPCKVVDIVRAHSYPCATGFIPLKWTVGGEGVLRQRSEKKTGCRKAGL